MNWIDHEYLVTVMIGNSREGALVAKRIYKLTQKRTHVFAEKFSLLQRFKYITHKVDPWRDFLVIESLIAFAQSLEGYHFPVLISCNESSQKLIEKYSEILDCYYVSVKACDITEY